RIARIGDVNPVNVIARGRVGTVVVGVVADHLGVGRVDHDAPAARRAATVRVLHAVDVVADDLRGVPGGVDGVAAARRPGHVEALDGHIGPVVGPSGARPAGNLGAPFGVGDIGVVRRGRPRTIRIELYAVGTGRAVHGRAGVDYSRSIGNRGPGARG